MATDVDKTSSIPKIRTFAADLDAVRGVSKRPQTEPEPEKKDLQEVADEFLNISDEEAIPGTPIQVTKITKPPAKKPRAPKPTPPKQQSAPVKIKAKDLAGVREDNRASLLEDKEQSFNISDENASVNTATIVTDKKNRRWKLLPSLIRSVRDWFRDFNDSYLTKKPPKYTVSGSYRRKGVITDGSVTSGLSHVDHRQVVERVKQRRKNNEQTNKQASSAMPLLLEAPEETNAAIPDPVVVPQKVVTTPRKTVENEPKRAEEEQRRLAELEKQEAALKKREEELLKAETEADELKAEAKNLAERERAKAEAEAEELLQKAAEEVASAEEQRSAAERALEEVELRAAQAARAALAEVTGPLIPEDVREAAQPQTLKEQLRDTNSASILAVVGIACIIIVYIIGQSVYSIFLSGEVVEETLVVPQLIAAEQIQIPLQQLTTAQLRETITQADSRVQQFDSITTETAGRRIATPNEIGQQLQLSVDPAFVQSAEQLVIGGFDRTYAFLLIETTDYETALGGMLGWEETIVTDVANLFLVPNQSGSFTDTQITEIATRTHDSGLTYGFVDQDTILITPNTFVFSEIIPLIQ